MEELRTLKRPRFVPPGGVWFYRVGERDLVSDQSIDDVVRQAAEYLRANDQEVPINLRAQVEHYMCGFLPPGTCFGTDTRPLYERMPGFFEVTEGMERLFRGKDRQFVSASEADARAKICVPCKRHFLGLCTGCDGLRSTACSFVGGRKTAHDGHLGVCAVYRVPLNAVVHVKDLEAVEGLPENCWVTK